MFQGRPLEQDVRTRLTSIRLRDKQRHFFRTRLPVRPRHSVILEAIFNIYLHANGPTLVSPLC